MRLIECHSILAFSLLWLCTPVAALESNQGLTVEITAATRTIVLGEPLIVLGRVRNDTPSAVKIHRQNSPTSEYPGTTPFLLKVSEDGQEFATWSDGFGAIHATTPLELHPGDEVVSSLVILYSYEEGLAFPQAGDYWISTEIVVLPEVRYGAEPIQITVVEPRAQDRTAWSSLRNDRSLEKYGALIQSPMDSPLREADIKVLATFLERNSDSVYSARIALNIGRWYSVKRNQDAAKEIEYLELAKDLADTEFIRSEAEKALAIARENQRKAAERAAVEPLDANE